MFTGALKPYQEPAVDKGIERGNLLIAYEMGLGKTPIAIAIMEELLGLDLVDLNMVVCPSALKYQWAEALAKFCDVPTRQLKVGKEEIAVPTEEYCVIVDGTPKARAQCYGKIRDTRPDFVILTYESVVSDWQHVRRINPGCITIDEITAIKSFRAQRTRKIKRLKADYRFGLTGTPIENGKPEEIFSIMQWIDETVLGRFDLFDLTYIVRNAFGGVKRYKNLPLFHINLSEAMVRKTRLDPDVAPYLPDVEEETYETELDSKTAKVYRLIAKDLYKELKANPKAMGDFDLAAHYGGDATMDSSAGRVMSMLGALRMLCDHPDLIRRSAARYESDQAGGSEYCYKIVKAGVMEGLTGSPKLSAHVERVRNVLESNPANKVIVFSMYPEMARLISAELPEYDHVFFNGTMNSKEKAEAKARYTNQPECRIFYSSDAGGMGVDLFMANYLFNYDLPDSAGKSDQRNARHVRASSQFKKVFIANEVIAGSVEVRGLVRLGFKRKVATAIMDGKGADMKGRIVNDIASLTEWLESSTV